MKIAACATPWREISVAEIAAPGPNSMATGPFGSSIGSRFFKPSGVPIIRGANLSTDPGIRLRDQGLVFLSPEKAAEFSRSTVRQGDLVFTCWGTINQIGLIDRNAAYPEYVISNKQMKLTPDPRRASSTFLYHLFSSPAMQREILGGSIGSSVPGFNLTRLRSMKISLPNVTEQRAIAQALDDGDDLIATLERLIAKKQAIKQGMMQQLLTDKTRLPGFIEPWSPRRLYDMLSYEQPGKYLVQSPKQLETGRVPVLTAGKTFILGYTNETHGVYRAHPVIIFDDFTTALQYVDFDFKAKSSAMKILSAKAGTNIRFVYERMQLIDFRLGDHKRYWISEYSEQEITVPTEAEQQAITAIIVEADDEIDLLKRRLAKARSTKTGMMQELLTGRTPLPVAEAAS